MEKAIKTLFFSCLIGLLITLPGNLFQWSYHLLPFNNTSNPVRLTVEEQTWLKNHQPIRIAFDGDNPPYSFIDESGQLAGIAYDTIQLISKKLNIQFKTNRRVNWQKIYKAALAGKIDVIATMVNRPERRFDFVFSQPYLFKSLVLIAHKSNEQIKSVSDLSGKTIALVRNYQYSQGVLNTLQNVTPLYVDSIDKALFAVETRLADATISFFASSSFLQNKHLLHNIKYVALYDLNNANESIAVRKDWPLLISILQKGLNAITKEEQQMINQLWHSPTGLAIHQEVMDKTYMLLLLIVFALLMWVAHIKRQNRRCKISEKILVTSNDELNKLNANLSKQISQDAEQIQSKDNKFQNLVENLKDEYFLFHQDLDGVYTYISPSIENVLGYTVEEFAQNSSTYQMNHPDNAKVEGYSKQCLSGEKASAYLIEMIDSKGKKHTLEIQESPVYDSQEVCIGLSGIAHDITQLLQAREQLNILSYYDDLTGLANMRLFSDRIEQMISLSRRQQKSLALLFINLDGFKLINESFGHTTGDEALKETANRLTKILRDSDTAARIEGDKFALILLDSGRNAAKVVTKKILNSLLNPFAINEQQFSLGCSIGIAIYPQDGDAGSTLFAQAENAMYFAKNNNKAYAFCTQELDAKSQRRLEIEQALRKTLADNAASGSAELALVYQSKHDVRDNSIQDYEALIRWQHPELGMISPDEFIPLAEQTGLIVDLSRWVITQACLQAIQWTEEGVEFKKIAINISAIELINFDLARNIIKQIDATGALREWIEIEITESAVMKMPDVSCKFIEQLVDAGVLITIDHYKGQSSLSFLKQLPASYLKIDPVFIHGIVDNPEDHAAVQALISTSHALDKKVIAIEVETEEQFQLLKEHGCDIIQGYFFSRPSTPEQVALYISEIFSVRE
ncbi:MAG: diguanylate cyclase [Gammaproteobacteria bacterium]|nr:MAG: diguanylate cyclase [Gammaproteobacteria bacterium]